MMDTRLRTQLKPASPRSFSLMCGGLLQRNLGCCELAGGSGACNEPGNGRLLPQGTNQNLELATRSSRGILPNAHDEIRPSREPLDASPCALIERRLGHDFGKVRVHSGDRAVAPAVNDQTPLQSGGPGKEFKQEGDQTPAPDKGTKNLNHGEDETKAPPMPLIDQVELVSSATGAIGGFPGIECDASLNNPGPFNDLWFKDSVANVHQVHFHLSQ